jgi:glycosyltransferase involved in cell wall biosynthesis
MKVLMNIWPYFLLSHVGDYYANTEVSAMEKQFPDMQFVQVRSPTAIAAANMRALVLHAAHKLRLLNRNLRILQPLFNLQCISYLPGSYLRDIRPDVIFAHSHIPRLGHGCSTPLVAVEYFASERYMRMAGVLRCLPREIHAKRLATEHAQVILTTTPASKARFDQYVPEARGRVLQAPIYMPYLEPVTDDYAIQKAQEEQELQVLFVGGAARRKGLPQVLEALRMIEKPVRDRLKLKVVSNFQDGPVPGIERVAEVLSNVRASDMTELMQKAHIFVFPTQFDTYGRVIVEAMAGGCAIISSNTDPQDWMLGYGKAGIAVDTTSSEEIAEGLTLLAEDRNIRMNYALSAIRRFREVFYHRVVGMQYRNAFETAIKTVAAR